jgi:hypothetical protein
VRSCPECQGPVEQSYRYCPWCSAPQRRKIVEFFTAHPLIEQDRGRALRVSRYFGAREEERHVRLSVWNESGAAEAAVSLDEAEAGRLGAFVLEHIRPPPARRKLGDVLARPLSGRRGGARPAA